MSGAVPVRRQTRLRKEYLYRKSLEGKEKAAYERKRLIRTALQGECVRDGRARPGWGWLALHALLLLRPLIVNAYPMRAQRASPSRQSCGPRRRACGTRWRWRMPARGRRRARTWTTSTR